MRCIYSFKQKNHHYYYTVCEKKKISGSFIALSERFSHGVIWDKKRNVGDFFMQLSGRSWDIDLALV